MILRQRLYKFSSKIFFRDELWDKLVWHVIVSNVTEQDAKKAAIQKFKEALVGQEQSFEDLEKMTPEQLKEAYKSDASLKSLHTAARGELDVHLFEEDATEAFPA